MATVCGGSLALFDAGVSMLHPVAGVACGLVSRKSKTVADDELEQYSIITDILVCTCVHTCSYCSTLKHTQEKTLPCLTCVRYVLSMVYRTPYNTLNPIL